MKLDDAKTLSDVLDWLEPGLFERKNVMSALQHVRNIALEDIRQELGRIRDITIVPSKRSAIEDCMEVCTCLKQTNEKLDE